MNVKATSNPKHTNVFSWPPGGGSTQGEAVYVRPYFHPYVLPSPLTQLVNIEKKCKAFKCVWTLHPHIEKLNRNMYKEGI